MLLSHWLLKLTLTVELAPLRPARQRIGKSYVKAYFKHFPISDPKEDQDDRNALYYLYNVLAIGRYRKVDLFERSRW